jgi:hypothetical protein
MHAHILLARDILVPHVCTASRASSRQATFRDAPFESWFRQRS